MIDPNKLAEIVAGIKIGDTPAKRQEPTEPDPAVVAAVAAIVTTMNLTPKPELTQQRLKEVLDYDPETGLFRWKIKGSGVPEAGAVAGYVRLNKQANARYVFIKINNRAYCAHVLAWLYVYGKFPKKSIDHIDRQSTNNRIANLLEADGSIQKYNSNPYQNNPSGHSGVFFAADGLRRRRWRARIGDKCLGSYWTYEEAVAARQAAEVKLLGCLARDLKHPEYRQPKLLRRL